MSCLHFQLLQVPLNLPIGVSKKLSIASSFIWLEFLYLDTHQHEKRSLSITQNVFQQCDNVILVLQPLCDYDKCVLHCLKSILNIASQGVGNYITDSWHSLMI
jgi:hypothetical protein